MPKRISHHFANKIEFAEINITPFTDVVLVLLLIFMIASPVLISGAIKVKLPEAVYAETQLQEKTTIHLYLTETNELLINEQSSTPAALRTLLQDELSRDPDAIVVLDADKSVTHGNFVHILDILKSSGVKKVAIGVQKKQSIAD